MNCQTLKMLPAPTSTFSRPAQIARTSTSWNLMEKSNEPKLKKVLSKVRHLVKRFARCEIDESDITQNCMLRLLKANHITPKYEKRWLFMVVKNTAYDYYRRSDYREQFHDRFYNLTATDCRDEHEHVVQPFAVHEQSDPYLVRAMNGALEKLSKTQYHTLMLWSSGYSFNEIAQLTATNLGTVKSRLHYARKKMQSLLADYCV